MTQKNTVTLVRPLDVIAEDDLPNQTHIWHLYQQSDSCLWKLSANLEVKTLTLTI